MRVIALLLAAQSAMAHVVPGKVKPTFPATYDMARSSGMMTCNAEGPVDPVAASKWGMIDLDVSVSLPAAVPRLSSHADCLSGLRPCCSHQPTAPLPCMPSSGMAASQCGPPPTP